MPRFSRKTYIIAAVVLLIAGLFGYSRLVKPKTTYVTQAVDRGTVVSNVSVTGSIAAKTKVTLQPETSGKVVKIFVKEGDTVKVGDQLLALDNRDILSRVAAQQASVEAAVAQLNQLIKGATDGEIRVAQTSVDSAKAQRDAAWSAKSDAQTSLDNARKNLDNVRSRADSYLKSKVDAFVIDYDQTAYVAADSFNRLTSQMYNGSDLLNFNTTNASAQSEAESSRMSSRLALQRIQTAVDGVKADDAAAAAAAYSGVMADLAVVNDNVNDSAAVLNYAPTLTAVTLASYQANVNLAQTNMNAVMQKLSTDKSGLDLQEKSNASDIQNAETAVANAQAALNSASNGARTSDELLAQAQAALDLKRAPTRPELIDAQRAQVHAAQATLEGLRTDLAKRTIIASIDAIVTQIPVEKGETISPGQAAVILNTRGNFEIISNVSEIDIARVSVGNSVSVTLDAFSDGSTWTGKVVSIQPAEKIVEGVVFYETKILFDNEDARLRPGMTANLEIETGRREDVLRLPIRSVKEKSGKKYVVVMRAGQPTESEVQIGLENNEYAEALGGVAEGDLVVTSSAIN